MVLQIKKSTSSIWNSNLLQKNYSDLIFWFKKMNEIIIVMHNYIQDMLYPARARVNLGKLYMLICLLHCFKNFSKFASLEISQIGLQWFRLLYVLACRNLFLHHLGSSTKRPAENT